MPLNMTTTCLCELDSRKPEVKDWGFSYYANNELEALCIAYVYRNSSHGVKVERIPAPNNFMITVWNSKAKEMGCDV
jgi:hypothetical protein